MSQLNKVLYTSIVSVPDVAEQYALHMIALLINFRIPEAKFLSKRIPDPVAKSSETLAAVGTLLTSLAASDFENFFQVATNVPGKYEYVTTAVDYLIKSVVESNKVKISKLYTSIDTGTLSVLCNLQPGTLPAFCQANGWRYDENAQMVWPGQGTVDESKSEIKTRGIATNAELDQLATYVMQLEASVVPPS